MLIRSAFYLFITLFFMLGFLALSQQILHATRQNLVDSHQLRLAWLELPAVILSLLVMLILRGISFYPNNLNLWLLMNLQLLVMMYSITLFKSNLSYGLLAIGAFLSFGTLNLMGVVLMALIFLVCLGILFLPDMIPVPDNHLREFELIMIIFIGASFWLSVKRLSPTISWWQTLTMMVSFIVVAIADLIYYLATRQEHSTSIIIAQHTRYDSLTSLKNWSAFREDFDDAFATASTSSLVVATFDIDAFKDINDHYGHLVGNRALSAVASTLTATLKPYHFDQNLYRTGGEEFSIIFPRTSINIAEHICEDCQESIRNLVLHEEAGALHLTAAIGLTCKWGQDHDATITFQRAGHYASRANPGELTED